MGGALILVSIAISTLLWADLSNRYVWVVLIVTLLFGAIGWVDDYRKVVYRDPRGMSSREKFFWQTLIGLVAAVYLAFSVSESSNVRVWDLFLGWVEGGLSLDMPYKSNLIVPFFKEVSYPLGVAGFIVLTYLVIVGSSNAVNLTDGLDGLVIMPVVLVGSGLGVFAYVMGSSVYSKYLLFPHIPGAGELLIFCSALAGAGLAFLWFNAHPAQVFMGDTGSLPIGALLGLAALVTRQEILLLVVGGVFVVETLSVILQVGWFRATGRRLIACSPLHNHFLFKGQHELKIVVRFWIGSALLAIVAAGLLAGAGAVGATLKTPLVPALRRE